MHTCQVDSILSILSMMLLVRILHAEFSCAPCAHVNFPRTSYALLDINCKHLIAVMYICCQMCDQNEK